MTDAELQAIRERAELMARAIDHRDTPPLMEHIERVKASIRDVFALVAEVERLRQAVKQARLEELEACRRFVATRAAEYRADADIVAAEVAENIAKHLGRAD